MRKIFTFVLLTVFSLLLSYLFNFFFLNLSGRSAVDQFLLIFFLTCPLIWIFYFIWTEGQKINLNWNFRFSFSKASLIENLPGILLSLSFFLIYLYYGLQLRDFSVGQVDNLFDADVGSWMRRISYEDVKDFEMRGPHPFTYFILRPFGAFLNFITNDPPLSAILLNTLVGGACVYLAWLFIKRQFQSKAYAFLIASLLGLSTSHLFAGSVIDSYIFSAFALILFFLLLQRSHNTIAPLVFAGALTFGITLTNFVQNIIGFSIVRPQFKEIFRFVGWVISISLILTFLHAAVYPASKLFFLTSDIQNEEKFFAEISDVPAWRLEGRTIFLARTMLLYTVVAPKVFILIEEVGSVIPEFRFYKISPGTFHQANYDGLGQGLVGVWILLLSISVGMFLWNLVRTKKADVSLSFMLCLLFNFSVHFFYGQELFLYSPNWAYALIFFVAFGLAPFAKNRLFQTGMLVFLILLAFHQWQFSDTILQTISEFMASLG